jgi:hypothetical protein
MGARQRPEGDRHPAPQESLYSQAEQAVTVVLVDCQSEFFNRAPQPAAFVGTVIVGRVWLVRRGRGE